MEVVLLWLDDIDDLLFSAALAWERLRRACLQAGLLAACTLAVCELYFAAAAWTPIFAAVAMASVGVWFVSAALAVAASVDSDLARNGA
jgi:CHASE2 domain-containing sensor protein